MKNVAPSPQLRTWFAHDPNRFTEFSTLYREELDTDESHQQAVGQIVQWLQEGPVTLVYAARDAQHNHAVVLKAYVLDRLR
ncbi:DNA topoisomerase I [Alicyclobacillus hesperidum URH17-3-68]|nr:DNA topoisomerase I [Alicyclobacillus hesperidum URH17-3-68]